MLSLTNYRKILALSTSVHGMGGTLHVIEKKDIDSKVFMWNVQFGYVNEYRSFKLEGPIDPKQGTSLSACDMWSFIP